MENAKTEATLVFISLSAGADGSVWGIVAPGTLYASSFTRDPDTGDRVTSWQAVASPTSWKRVCATGPAPLWCLDGAGHPFRVTVAAQAATATAAGDVVCMDLSVGSDGTAWALASNGDALRFDDNQWVKQPQPKPFTRLSVADATHVMALGGDDGTVYTLAGSAWQAAGSGLLDISLPSNGYAVGVGQKGNLLIQIGDDWQDTGGASLRSISAGSLSNVVALDNQGGFVDLTHGHLLMLGTGRMQSTRFDTEDPYDETKSTHLWIVNRGALLATGATGGMFRSLFKPDVNQTVPGGSPFHQGVCQGVYDADFNAFFNGPTIGPQPSYESHFYDPDTKLNWRDHADPTALSRGRQLFYSALAAYRAGKLEAAGYALGVSLHYLTDLGQPMHAANFSNVSFPWSWHGGFETIVLEWQSTCPMPSAQVPVNAKTIPDDYFIQLARLAKAIFNQTFSFGFGGWIHYNLGGVGNTEHAYRVTTVRTILQPMLTNAIQAVAGYVSEWMRQAADVTMQANAPICAAQQGAYWHSVLWSTNPQGDLQYWYLDRNDKRTPYNRQLWFPGAPSDGAPKSPTQLAACMSSQETDGRGYVFALAGGNLYSTSQLSPYVSDPEHDVSGWTPWTQWSDAPKLKLLCACPYGYHIGAVLSAGASLWGVGDDGLLRMTYNHSTNLQKEFDPFKPEQNQWSDWQVDASAPKNIDCLAASGSPTESRGSIFALAGGELYWTTQNDLRNSNGWADWAKTNIPGPAVSLRLISACEAPIPAQTGRVYALRIWGVDTQGLLRSASFDPVGNQWSPWSGEWQPNSPRNAVALTASCVVPSAFAMQLWALADGHLYCTQQKIDAQTKQLYWSEWSVALGSAPPPPVASKFTLPIGPLKMTIGKHDLPFLAMEIRANPDPMGLDPASGARSVLVALNADPGASDWIPGKMNLNTGALFEVNATVGDLTTTYQGQFTDNTHASGTVLDRGITENWILEPMPIGPGPHIDSVAPADQVAAGYGQLLFIRGSNLPSTVICSQNGQEYPAQWRSSADPTLVVVRLSLDLVPGPATVRLTDDQQSVRTQEFPITISATPGAPQITSVSVVGGGKIAPGKQVAITAVGMDTWGAVIQWLHPGRPTLGSPSIKTFGGGAGCYSVLTTVPEVTLNDTWILRLQLSVKSVLSPPSDYPVQT